MAVLGRLRVWQKLAVLVAAMLVPLAILVIVQLRAADAAAQLARDELSGAEYTQALGQLLVALVRERGAASMAADGDDTQRAGVAAARAAGDAAVDALGRIDADYGAGLGTSADWQTLRRDWIALRAALPELSADQSYRRHNELIDSVAHLTDLVVVNSGLAVDPVSATNSLIDVVTQAVPSALDIAGRAQVQAAGSALKGYLAEADRVVIEASHADVVAVLRDVDRRLAQAGAGVGRVDASVRPAFEAARREFAAFGDFVDQRLLGAESLAEPGASVFAAAAPALDAFVALARAAYDVMRDEVAARSARATRQLQIMVAASLLALALAAALAWIITRAVTHPLARAIHLFERIAAGHYDDAVGETSHDELGEVLRSLGAMQSTLRARIEADRQQANANLRIRQSLDKVAQAVVVGDADDRIVYANEAAQALFERCAAQFRQVVPGFDPAGLIGSPVNLHGAALSQASEVAIGPLTFRLTVTPVIDANGERVGVAVEWRDRTEAIAIEREVNALVAGAVAGDLGGRIELAGKTGFFGTLSAGMNALLDNMEQIVMRIRDAAHEVLAGAEEISQGNAHLSQRTEEQASSLEETATAIEEMTTTVRQNADNAAQANQLAIAARDQADRGGSVVQRAVEAMGGINEASRRIADIISVIDDIAFQTNLLALNAAVEAARAGEQGRGFAVVASEVRNLAQRSAAAAREIKGLIQDSERRVEEGSTLVLQSGQTLEEIVAAVKKASDIVAEIAAASREQSAGIEQVNKAVVQLDELTQQNAALVEQAAAASESMADQARALGATMNGYRTRADAAGESGAAGAGSADARAGAAKATVPADAGAAVRGERRRAGRPWVARAARGSADWSEF